MKGFFETLWESPPATPLSQYIVGNGLFYMLCGALFYAWPGVLQVAGGAEFVGHEAGMTRALGAVTAIIGWFYVMGGRTRAASFGLSTVVDRALVPALLLPLAYTGAVDPYLAVPFSILDPLLAIGAFIIWRRSAQEAA